MQKLLFVLMGIGVNFALQYYAHHFGKLPASSSLFLSTVWQTLKYVWSFALVNVFFTYGFQIGPDAFKSFLIAIILWTATAPIATVLLNTLVLKESLNWLTSFGLILIFLGSIAVIANQELLKLLQK